MFTGLPAHHAVCPRRLTPAVCAGVALAWLALALPAVELPPWRTPAEPAEPPAFVWFPLVAAPLLWVQGLRR